MRTVLCVIGALSLAGCQATPEEQKQDVDALQSRVPAGCTLEVLGRPRIEGTTHRATVFFVRCDNATTETTSTSEVQQEGKTTVTVENTVFEIKAVPKP